MLSTGQECAGNGQPRPDHRGVEDVMENQRRTATIADAGYHGAHSGSCDNNRAAYDGLVRAVPASQDKAGVRALSTGGP